MSETVQPAAVLSPIGRVAYPNMAKARQRKPTDKPRWSITLVYPAGTDLNELKLIAQAAALKKFPGGIPADLRSPFRPGAHKRREDGSLPAGFKEDDIFVEFWRYEEHGRAPCVDNVRKPDGEFAALLPSDIYAGMTGRVLAKASGYSVDGNKGVSMHVEAFQKAHDGEPIGAAPVNPHTAFDDIEGATAAPAVADASSLF